MEQHIIKEGDFILVKKGLSLHLTQVFDNRNIFLAKRKLKLNGAIGKPYGSYFEMKGAHLEYCEIQSKESLLLPEPGNSSERKDNRSIVDDGKSQKLTKDDIEVLKAKGVSGEEIVENLIENSTTFKEKSAYSQEKYLKKKKEKYVTILQILKPNARLLSEMYYWRDPSKTRYLRMDTLSQMISNCNVMSGAKCLVVDNVMGLLSVAVLERLGGNGLLINVCPELDLSRSPTTNAVKILNLSKDILQSLFLRISFQDAFSLLQPESSNLIVTEDVTLNETNEQHPWKIQKQLERENELMKAKEILFLKEMDCLLIATEYDLVNAVILLDFLSYSRPFAIFSTYQQTLVDCYVHLKSRGDIIYMNLTESFLRSYQVLPERTHPNITESNNGGYLLTGIKVKK